VLSSPLKYELQNENSGFCSRAESVVAKLATDEASRKETL
jgi:hypothetical protein